MRPLIVAQAPSSRSNPSEPLSGASGRRLAALCGLTLPDFLVSFERVNLLDMYPGKLGKGDKWDHVRARLAAYNMTPRLRRRCTILLGWKVASAFQIEGKDYFRWHDNIGDGAFVSVCPHPSGIVLWWNHPENVARARAFWRDLAQP
jgi:hypothetical protein